MRSIHGALLSILVACSYALPANVPPPQLLAIHPPIANTGDTITLEGTFFGDTMVHFPGGVVRRATPLGMERGMDPVVHRMSVVVPEGVTASDTAEDLYVSTVFGSRNTNPLPFRLAAFGAVQDFRLNACGPLDTRLTKERGYTGAVVIKNYLYVLGGGIGTGSVNTVERAVITGGRLGKFQVVDGLQLARARNGFAIAVAGEWLYLIGGVAGHDDQEHDNTIERAHINSDGSLGQFKLLDETLHKGRQQPASEVIGNKLYVLGGDDFYVESAEICPDELCPDGELGAFVIDDNVSVYPEPTNKIGRFGMASAVIGESLYVIGGSFYQSDAMTRVDQAQI